MNLCELQERLILLWYDNGIEMMGGGVKIDCNEHRERYIGLWYLTNSYQRKEKGAIHHTYVVYYLKPIQTKIKPKLYAGNPAMGLDSTKSMPGQCL